MMIWMACAALAVTLILWVWRWRDVPVSGTFRERHLQHPIASFATGTWVAAHSVACVQDSISA